MPAGIYVTDDRKTLVYRDGPASPVQLSAERVETMLNALGLARSGMLPEIPETWISAMVRAQRDPKCSVEADALAGDALLHLRDRHFGWRHYVLTKDEARKLGQALIAQADAAPPAAFGTA